MGCCGQSANTGKPPGGAEQQYTVTLPSGEVKVLGEHAAKVAITMAGGGRMEPVKS